MKQWKVTYYDLLDTEEKTMVVEEESAEKAQELVEVWTQGRAYVESVIQYEGP